MILHYVGAWRDPGELEVGQCTMRRGRKAEGPGWWMLWARVLRDDGGGPLTFAVAVNPGGGFFEGEPAGKTWGLASVGPGTHEWQISPSINVEHQEAVHAGEGPAASWWHQTPKIVNVPDDEPWVQHLGDLAARKSAHYPIRLARAVGRRAMLRAYWDSCTYESGKVVRYANSCPNAWGRGGPGCHEAMVEVRRALGDQPPGGFGVEADYLTEAWPKWCSGCGEPVPSGELSYSPQAEGFTGVHLYGHKQLFETDLWDTPSDMLEIGCAWWATPEGRGHAHSHAAGQCFYWDDCDDRHLRVLLPDGTHWDVMSRATNCARPDDKSHRCWSVEGDPATPGSLSVGRGPNWENGGGSIATPNYHGFVQQGVLQP